MSLRITYAGSIQFITLFATLFTGLAFVTIITRNLTVEEFGLWQILGTSAGLAILPLSPIYYWTLRFISRGEDVGKTALYSSIVSLPLIIGLYLVLMTVVETTLTGILFFAVIFTVQIPFLVIFESLKGVIQGSRPQFMGYASIPFEIGKVIAAYYLVIIHGMGLMGAIISLAAAHSIQVLVMAYGARDRLRGKFQLNILRSWMHASWIPILGTLASRLWLIDALIISIIIGSTMVAGLFQAARTFVAIVSYSEIFLRVMYPKLMRDRIASDVSLSVKLQTMIQVPLAVGAFVLAEPLLGLLNIDYVVSATLLRVLVLVIIIEGFEHVMDFVLIGAERSDVDIKNLKFSKLKGSWLVKLPLLDLAKTIIYLAILIPTIFFVNLQGASEITLALYWGIIFGITVVPFTVIKIIAARKVLPHHIPLYEMSKYALSGVFMAIFLYYYTSTYLWVDFTLLGTLFYLVVPGITSLAIYAAFVYILDPYFRSLIHIVIDKIGRSE